MTFDKADLLRKVIEDGIQRHAPEIAFGLFVAAVVVVVMLIFSALARIWRWVFPRRIHVRVEATTRATSHMISPPAPPSRLPLLRKALRVIVAAEPPDSAPARQATAVVPIKDRRARDGRLQLSAAEIGRLQRIAAGGEGTIYYYGDNVVKIFHQPEHYAGNDPQVVSDRKAAVVRLGEYETKLPAFPKGLPDSIVAPIEVVYDGDQLIGFRMSFVQGKGLDNFCSIPWCEKNGITREMKVEIALCLIETIKVLHAANIVVGDLKPQNVMVQRDGTIRLVDMESTQYGGFTCHAFSAKYVDPKICDPNAPYMMKVQAYTPETDLYALNAIIFELLYGCGPYEGFQKPRIGQAVPEQIRALKGVTQFDDDMSPPKTARIPTKAERKKSQAEDAVWEFLYQVFEQGNRSVFPRELLEALLPEDRRRAIQFRSLGFFEEFLVSAPEANVPAVEISVARTIAGPFLGASSLGNVLRLARVMGQQIVLDDGRVLLDRYRGEFGWARLCGETILGGDAAGNVFILDNGNGVKQLEADVSAIGLPAVATDGTETYFVRRRWIRTVSAPDTKLVKAIHQPVLLAGSGFGVILLEAKDGKVQGMRIIDTKASKVIDCEPIPYMRGELRCVAASFTAEFAWLCISTQAANACWTYAIVVNRQGKLVGFGVAETGSESWLGQPGPWTAVEGASGVPRILALSNRGVEVVEVLGRALVTKELWKPSQVIERRSELLYVGGEIVFNSIQQLTVLSGPPQGTAIAAPVGVN